MPEGSAIGELLITEERLAFVNGLLDEPLTLRSGQKGYLSEAVDHDGEVVHD